MVAGSAITKKPISIPLLAQLNAFVDNKLGLHFPANRWTDLERGIKAACPDLGFDNAEACIAWLVSSAPTPKQIGILANHLTIGETYFFREQKTLKALENHILPTLINQRRTQEKRLRLWSAGCCTGEEPYTLAIMLHRLLPDLKNWQIEILATDLNPYFLQKAQQGLYREWSFRQIEPAIKEQYFSQAGQGQYQIAPHIKQMVKFSQLNLKESSYPSAHTQTEGVDIILCRNVLMYFSPETIKQIVKRMYQALTPEGWFITSLTETGNLLDSPFIPMIFSGATLYQKTTPKIKAVAPAQLTLQAKPAPAIPAQPAYSAPPITVVQQKPAFSYEQLLNLYQQGEYQAVIQHLGPELASRLDSAPFSNQAPALELLIRAYANLGQLAQAEQWCQRAINADKLNAAYYYLLAVVYQAQNEFALVAKALKQALFLNHKFALAHFALGNQARLQGKVIESERHLRNALNILEKQDPQEILSLSEGLTAGKLKELIGLLIETRD